MVKKRGNKELIHQYIIRYYEIGEIFTTSNILKDSKRYLKTRDGSTSITNGTINNCHNRLKADGIISNHRPNRDSQVEMSMIEKKWQKIWMRRK